MPARSGPLDAVVGGLVASLRDGVEFREVLDHRVEGSFHTTADGRHWIAVRESVVADEAVRTPSVLHWRLLPVAPPIWTRPDGPLLSPELITEVEHALTLFARRGDPGYDDLVRAARSALPAIHRFGQILTDAWSVLQGDRDAAERFRDAVTALAATGPPPADDTLRQLTDLITSEDDERWEELAGEAKKAQPGLRAVPMDREAILLLAAFQVAEGGDRAVGARYAAILHDQVCQYDTFATLHRSAVRALAGDETARKSLWGQLGLLGAPASPGGLAWPDPPAPPNHRPLEPHPLPPWPPSPWPAPKPPSTFPERPWPPWRGIDPCILLIVKTLALSQNHYQVTGVTPARACPGTPITITGSGFGSTPYTVWFRKRGTAKGSPPIDVAPTSWSDTKVVAVVPQDAGAGLQLAIPIGEGAYVVCGGSIVRLFKVGDFTADFGGGAPDVMLFSVDGVAASEGIPAACTIEPSTLAITWDVRAADHVTVEVRGPGNVVLGVKKPAPPAGSWEFDASTITKTTTLQARLVATGTCEPAVVERLVNVTVQRTPNLYVHGIEVTQAIQHYRAAAHLTDPGDIGPDNSLQLVADKPAYVRVYVRSGQDPGFDDGQLPGVTGMLAVRRRVGGKWTLVATLPPTPTGATVTAQADPPYAAERGTLAASLNFIVPAGHMFGHLRLSAEVTSLAAAAGGGPAHSTVDVDVTLRQTLRVAGIGVGYNGPTGPNAPPTAQPLVLAPPTQADLVATAALALRMFPVSSSAQLWMITTHTQTAHLADPRKPPGCSVNWDALMDELRELADEDGNQPGTLYYGLLANGIPIGGPLGVGGCGGDGVGVGPNGNGVTMAEELGHALGLQHAPCGGAPSPGYYPAYEPYETPPPQAALIGEYGLDINTAGVTPTVAVRSPWTHDFMSYCGPKWISPYNHGRLLNVGLLSPVTLSPAGAEVTSEIDERHRIELQAVVSLTAFLNQAGDVETVHVRRLVTRPDHRRDEPTEIVAELIGAQGEVLSSGVAHVVRLRAPGPFGCHEAERCRRILKAYLPDAARGARLRLRRGNEELWSREAPAVPVSVSGVVAGLDEDGRLAISWETAVSRGATWRASVRWSADGGETWHPLTVGLTGQEARLDIDCLPGGELTFQVAVHDGFGSATGTSAPVSVPHKAPRAAVLHPDEDARLEAGATMRLWGAGFDEHGARLPDAACQWFLDDRPLDSGPDLFVDAPDVGRHHVRLLVQDGHGRSVAERSFSVVDERQS